MSTTLTPNNIPVGIGYDSNGDPRGLVELSSIVVPSTGEGYLVHTSATTTYTISDGDRLVYANGTFTITLPLASSNLYRVVDIHNIGTGTITIDGNGSETINGSLTTVMATQYDSITLHCDGVEWRII